MGWLDRLIGGVIAGAQWLALPLVLLLFLQWPLRDIVRCCSREANDLGQIVFALLVAASVTAATRAGTHLAADTLAQRYSPRTRHRLRRIGAAIGLIPWALFIVYASRNFVLQSALGLEILRRYGEPRLFHHQARALAHGAAGDRAVGGRHFPPPPSGRHVMEWSGFVMLLLVGVGIVTTGLPAAFILITVAVIGAVVGVVTDTIPFALLSALPNRLINLFENDLLQALPLYVTMGLLLGPPAGRRRALPHRQCDFAAAAFGAAGLRHDAWRPARPDEWLGRRQRARPVARGGAPA